MADHPPLRPSTLAVTTGRPEKAPDAPLNHPLTMASTYVAGGAARGDRERGGPELR